MKKIKWFFLAIVFAAVSSAFASNHAAKSETEFYLDNNGVYTEVTTNGLCAPAESEFCKYTLAPGHENDQDPSSYIGVPGTENQVWIP